MLILSITGKCNYACTYCYASEHNQSVMPLEVAIAALNEVSKRSSEPFALQFTGGEPLIYFEQVTQVIDYVKEHNIPAKIQIQTNGSLITPEIAKYLKKNRCGVGVSLDGDPKINCQTRPLLSGRDSTSKTIRGIQILKEHQVACGLTCVITKENVHHLDRIVDVAYYLGNVRKIGFNLLKRQGRGSKSIAPDYQEITEGVEKFFLRLKNIEKMAQMSIDVSQVMRAKSLASGKSQCFDHCYAMTNQGLFVTPEGEYFACASLADNAEYRLGSISEGILELDKTRVANDVKNYMKNCFHCDDLALCGGGCFARWVDKGVATETSLVECAFKRKCIKIYKEDCLAV